MWDWKNLTVEAQLDDQNSMLILYRHGLKLRRELLGDGSLTWLPSAPDVLVFEREQLICVTNLSGEAVDLPPYEEVLIFSIFFDGGRLPSDATVWFR